MREKKEFLTHIAVGLIPIKIKLNYHFKKPKSEYKYLIIKYLYSLFGLKTRFKLHENRTKLKVINHCKNRIFESHKR